MARPVPPCGPGVAASCHGATEDRKALMIKSALSLSRAIGTRRFMIRITLNGESHPLADATTVAALLESRALAGKRVAVERNGEIVPRSRHADTRLADGDRLEIVVAVGGG